ncbi:retrovirus-related pol polyprotein from transposon TNT 1-94 [Tanacetum coccineum]
MDLCDSMRVKSINGKRYVLVIMDDYSRYIWVHFLTSKDEAPEEIKTFLEKIQVLLQAPVIIVRADNGTEFKNQVLKEYFDDLGISYQTSFVKTPQQNGVMEQRNQTALCYPKNDHGDIRKLGTKAMYDDYIGGQPSDALKIAHDTPATQNLQTPNASTTTVDSALTPTHSSSQATTIPKTSQDVDELQQKQPHVQQQDN